MRSLSSVMTIVGMSLICAATAPAVLAAPEFVNGLALDGALLDRSGGTDANNGRVGYFSDLYYDAKKKDWYGLSDRGPGGGSLDYQTRVQRFRLKVDRKTGAISGFKIRETIIFKDEFGNPMNGLAPSPTNVLGQAFGGFDRQAVRAVPGLADLAAHDGAHFDSVHQRIFRCMNKSSDQQCGVGCTPQPIARLYHSVAVLLQDGRVLVAGGHWLGPTIPGGRGAATVAAGVRPEAVRFAAAGLPATITAIEY